MAVSDATACRVVVCSQTMMGVSVRAFEAMGVGSFVYILFFKMFGFSIV